MQYLDKWSAWTMITDHGPSCISVDHYSQFHSWHVLIQGDKRRHHALTTECSCGFDHFFCCEGILSLSFKRRKIKHSLPQDSRNKNQVVFWFNPEIHVSIVDLFGSPFGILNGFKGVTRITYNVSPRGLPIKRIQSLRWNPWILSPPSFGIWTPTSAGWFGATTDHNHPRGKWYGKGLPVLFCVCFCFSLIDVSSKQLQTLPLFVGKKG